MKPISKPLTFCSRCGDDIPPDELQFLPDAGLCVLCRNIALEADEIRAAKRSKPKTVLRIARRPKSGSCSPA